VRARLLTRARETRQDFDLVLTRYALERLPYRLSVSPHADQFLDRATQVALGGDDLEEIRELLPALVDEAHDALAASAPAISDCAPREP
jgi:hypothetical protein